MSTIAQVPGRTYNGPTARTALNELPIDQSRGIQAMCGVIATEFMLFVCMFGAYYYLGSNKDRWANEMPPHLSYALILLVILLASSAVLEWGSKQVEAGRPAAARVALWVTVLLGIGFLVLQGFEYASEWKQITPYSDSYGSIFYTITMLHAAHVIVGLLLLGFVGVLPRYGLTRNTPHRPYKTVSLYWHFVDFVWVFIVLLLYVIPTFQSSMHGH